MTAPATPAPDTRNGPGCGAMLFCLLLTGGLLWLFPHLGRWPRERGLRSGLAVTGTSLLAIALTVALMSLWDRVRRR